MHLLVDMFARKIDNFTQRIGHNIDFERRKSIRLFHGLPRDRMERALTFDETSRERCECAETRFVERMYRSAASCAHRLALVIECTGGCKRFVDVVEGPELDSANAFRRWGLADWWRK
jgi:hypothetical protein